MTEREVSTLGTQVQNRTQALSKLLPQGIGLAERVIGTLFNGLRRTVDEVIEEWPDKLQEVVDAYNKS